LNPQQRFNLFHRFLRRQLEHVQILNDSRPFPVIGHQPVISRPKHRARVKRLPMPVVDKSSRLAQQWRNNVPKVHQRSPIPAQARQTKQELSPQIHLQFGLMEFHP